MGEARGCELVALRRGSLGSDYLDAVKQYFFRSTCSESEPRGCYNLALKQQKTDPAHAEALYQRACDGGVALACSNLGLLLQSGDRAKRDIVRVSALYERACAAGEPIGCTNLGQLYMNDRDAPRDPRRARVALEKACAARESVGCFNLAIMVEWGMGGARDAAQARSLYARSCKGGYQEACGRPGP